MLNLNTNTIFENREEASLALIETLPLDMLKSRDVVVLGISEDGVYFAYEIAKKLKCRMDLLLTEPIYSPINVELAIAMVSETEEVVMHKPLINAFGISKDYIYAQADKKYNDEIVGYVHKYRNGERLEGLTEKYVILVDACVETGLTMMTAIKTVISVGAKNVFIAVPILDNVVYESLVTICDNLFCPHRIDNYISQEYYYEHLKKFRFEDIDKIMKTIKETKDNE
ncbi:MAG: hypothetical protein KU29_03565 [Sulfurovum sp. FS06-10]|nr:MAG: hypothetical protein KU29_03565 [Sulfurovum sp. FS06-10]